MSNSHKISAYIIAYNQVEKIEGAINSILWADEIIVIDSHSTDGTTEKAQAMGAKIIQVEFKGFGDLRNQALAACQNDWIFSLDSDERCTPEVRDEIVSIIEDPNSKDYYFVPRKNFFMGRWIKHSGWYPNYRQPQLFKKSAFTYDQSPVHEGYKTHSKKPAGYLSNAIWQVPFKDLSEMMQKANRYSSLGVEKLAQKNRKVSMLSSLTYGSWSFIKHYFIKRGFLDGWPGLMIAIGNFYGTYFRYAKYYEQKMQWPLPESPPLRKK